MLPGGKITPSWEQMIQSRELQCNMPFFPVLDADHEHTNSHKYMMFTICHLGTHFTSHKVKWLVFYDYLYIIDEKLKHREDKWLA